ncbi:YadA domain family protein [Taylorella asinigenitalis 14/45]|uniref:YadA domain family protein n=1 Tax=Taylorella asinigenitalis 14/45 TaxID=1091495 RepID=I7ILD3_9BURK|nr:YadA-like family protein [Taylorella asinigenitalis]CCG19984.1 YadA domain family protein [Taylorella asinigenitalis 14/45]
MNKIYKSLFNSLTRTWVAVPEISKNHASGKSCKSRKLVTAAVGVAITVGSLVGQFALMDEAEAINWTHWRCGALIGGDGKLSTAYLCGGDHDESGNSIPMIINTAVGFDHNGSNTTAHHITGFGYANRFYQHIGVGIGGRNEIHSLGSVALGYQSVADRDYLGPDNGNTFNPASKVYLYNSPMVRQTIRGKMGAFSVGLRDIIRKGPDGRLYRYSGVTRQIINVAPGRQWSDAVNVAQLLAVENALKKYVDDNVAEIEKQLDNPIDKPDYTGNENHNGSLGDDKPDSNGVVGGEIPGPNDKPVLIDPSDNPGHDNPGGNTAGPDNPDDPNNPDSPFNPNNPSGPGDNPNPGVTVAGGGVAFKFKGNTGEDATSPKANSVVHIKGADAKDGETLKEEDFDDGENILTELEKSNNDLILRIKLRKNFNPQSITVGKGDPGTPGADGVNGEIKVINKIDKETVVVKGDENNGGVVEIYGPNGKDGRDGKDGKPGEPGLTLTSKDITFHNIPGTKGKDGKDGTGSSSLSMDAKDTTPTLNDKEGEPKTPRIVYTDPNNPDEKVEVATMKDGLIFSGDNGDTKLKNKLNTELKLVGGADINNVSENNISVAAVPAPAENPTNEIKVRLSKDLKGLNSAQFVNGTHETIIKPEGIVISKVVPAENDSNGSNGGSDSGSDGGDSTGSGNGATVTKPVVEINENGLDLKGEGSITGLKPSSDPNSATTLGQVQGIVSNSEVKQWRNTRESTATAVAMANLPQAYVPGKSMVAIAGGNHEGKAAVAVGISTISSSGKWVLKGSMAKSKSKFSAGVGVGYQW